MDNYYFEKIKRIHTLAEIGLEYAENTFDQEHYSEIRDIALKMLEKEGFRHRGYIDLFDAGPTVEAQLSEIRSVAQSRKVPVRITEVSGEHTLAVANTALQGFRASFGKGAYYCPEQQQLLLSPQFAAALALQEGDFARFINLDQR